MRNIQTVLGSVPADELGISLLHEHLIFDGSKWLITSKEPHLKALVEKKVEMSILGLLGRAAHCCKDNLVLDDVNLAVKEVLLFKGAGGGSIMELTLPGAGRNPLALKRIARRTGVNIVACCGYYVQATHPPFVAKASIDELEETMIRELTVGMDATRVKAGAIGEIGISPGKMMPNEKKVLKAAARAQIKTDVGLTVHTFDAWLPPEKRQTLPAISILEKEGVDLGRVQMCHLSQIADWDHVVEVAERGVFVAFDNCGTLEWPHGFDSRGVATPTDLEKAQCIKMLIDKGFLRQILLSHDVCWKTSMANYGGVGFAYIPRSFPKVLRYVGVKDTQIKAMLIDNPRKFLAG